jgi:hypothetical protein
MTTPIRHEYGTPRYELNDRVETSDRDLVGRDLDFSIPDVPDKAGYYILRADGWHATDGLTYRTHPHCILVKGS